MLLCSRTTEVANSPLDLRHTGWIHLRGSGSRSEAIYNMRAEEAVETEISDEDEGGE